MDLLTRSAKSFRRLLVITAMLVAPWYADAQSGAADLERRELACAAIDVVRIQVASRVEFEQAMADLSRCREGAGDKLSRMWSAPPRDSAKLAMLAHRSAYVLDARVLHVVMNVASDRSKPRDVRLAALKPMVYYVVGFIPVFGAFENGSVSIGSQVAGISTLNGAHPLPTDTKALVLARLRQLSSSLDEDEYIAAASRQLHWSLSRR